MTAPPRHLTSIWGSVALMGWTLGRDPSLKAIVACYGEELARDHAMRVRSLVRDPFYRRLFPATPMDPRSDRWTNVRTVDGCGRRAVSLGGAVTGLGADIIVIDDLMKAQDAGSEIKREEIGNYGFTAQHLQSPVAIESEHLRLERMTLFDAVPSRDEML